SRYGPDRAVRFVRPRPLGYPQGALYQLWGRRARAGLLVVVKRLSGSNQIRNQQGAEQEEGEGNGILDLGVFNAQTLGVAGTLRRCELRPFFEKHLGKIFAAIELRIVEVRGGPKGRTPKISVSIEPCEREERVAVEEGFGKIGQSSELTAREPRSQLEVGSGQIRIAIETHFEKLSQSAEARLFERHSPMEP